MLFYEADFVRKWLGDPPKRVLDVGCGPAFWLILRKHRWDEQGFEMWGADVQNVHTGPHFRKEDARQMSFPNNFFDVVYSVSTVEHIGFGGYGENKDVSMGDRKAVLEMARVLKPDGVMVVTVPCGEFKVWDIPRSDPGSLLRVYDMERLQWLFLGFKILDMEFWIKKPNWRRGDIEEILSYVTKNKNQWLGNANVAVKKREYMILSH